jgi:hypothetical protein
MLNLENLPGILIRSHLDQSVSVECSVAPRSKDLETIFAIVRNISDEDSNDFGRERGW